MIVSIIGARPQFVKAAVVSAALKSAGIEERIVHTGQHYDEKMSNVFWDELGLPPCYLNLGAGSGTHGAQTALMIEKLEQFLLNTDKEVKAVVLYGDTNSTLAGSIVASKLQIPIVHIEAGLRSFNRSMPEEINRIVTDHLSSLLFCSSQDAVDQLSKEGITKNVFNTGDVMYDALKVFSDKAEKEIYLNDILPFADQNFHLMTLHRPSNTDNPGNLMNILKGVEYSGVKTLWPLHPRLKEKISSVTMPSNIFIIEPLSYFQMMVALKKCSVVLTDSGGLQKEAYWLQKPCITLREETEWTETLNNGWNQLTGPDTEKIIAAFQNMPAKATWQSLYGQGNSSQQIVSIIKEKLAI